MKFPLFGLLPCVLGLLWQAPTLAAAPREEGVAPLRALRSVGGPALNVRSPLTFASMVLPMTLRLAQAGQEPLTPESPTPELEAGALYRLALWQISQGQFAEGKLSLEQVIRLYPETSSAARARDQLTQIETKLQTPATSAGQTSAPGKTSDDWGRAELLVSQSLVGGVAAELLTIAIDPAELKLYIIAPMVGLFSGLGGAYLYSRSNPITTPDAMAFYWSQYFLTVNTTLWYLTLSSSDNEIEIAMLSGILAGTGVGWAVSNYLDLSEGETSLVVTSGLWAGPTALFLTTALTDRPSSELMSGVPAAATDIALLAAASLVATRDIKISRGRMRLISLGGILGVATAAAVLAVVEAEDRALAGGLGVGALVGLGGGYLATQNWDKNYHPEWYSKGSSRPSILAYEAGRLVPGMPTPQLTFTHQLQESSDGHAPIAIAAPRVSLSLVSGSW